MRYSKFVLNSILLFAISLAHSEISTKIETEQIQTQNSHFLSYDAILNLLDEIESGELEEKCSPEDLERVNHFLAMLAKEGVLPNESEEELDQDIQELLYGEDDPEYAFSFGHTDSCVIIPVVFHGRREIAVYNNWTKKNLGKTKKFIKKHRKPIIIGAVVVVVVATVAYVVAAASSAANAAAVAANVAAAGAGATGAVTAFGSDKEEKDKSIPESETYAKEPPALAVTKEALHLKAALEEDISSFKDRVVKDDLLHTSDHPKSYEDPSFGENARNLGALLAHETLDGVSELVSCVPQLFEEVKDIGGRIMPESLLPSSAGTEITPMENYEKLIAAGHEKIDQAFSTNQAELYTPETKEGKNQFTIGIIPPPGMLGEIFANSNKLAEAGKAMDRAGFTKAGRALMKHGNREGSVFPKPAGNAAQVNEQGQIILEEILNDPKKELLKTADGGLKVYSSSGRGVCFKEDGAFKGFVERQYE